MLLEARGRDDVSGCISPSGNYCTNIPRKTPVSPKGALLASVRARGQMPARPNPSTADGEQDEGLPCSVLESKVHEGKNLSILLPVMSPVPEQCLGHGRSSERT